MARARTEKFGPAAGIAAGKKTGVGIDVNIVTDLTSFRAIQKAFPKETLAVLPSTLNRTGKTATTAASRALRKIYNIKQARLKKSIVEIKASKSGLVYTVKVRSRGIGLINFGARKVKRGISYAILKGKRRTIRGAFKAPMLGTADDSGSQREGVFIRKSTSKVPIKGRYKGRIVTRGSNKGKRLERQELQRFIGPGPVRMWERAGVQQAFVDRATEFFPREYNRMIFRKLNQLIAKNKAKG